MRTRPDRRDPDQLRPIELKRSVNRHAEGSAMIRLGHTHVLCTASIEERVPPWLRGSGRGWVTAQYGMLPRATASRGEREAARGRQSGRTQEIQRLIGRSLRTSLDLAALGKRTITLDCDVIQADGGTRTAAITGAWVALVEACRRLLAKGQIGNDPISGQTAAVSVGIYHDIPLLDLCYTEDKEAEADCNIVMNAAGEYVEIQGSAEGRTFSRKELGRLLDLAADGISELLHAQRRCLDNPP